MPRPLEKKGLRTRKYAGSGALLLVLLGVTALALNFCSGEGETPWEGSGSRILTQERAPVKKILPIKETVGSPGKSREEDKGTGRRKVLDEVLVTLHVVDRETGRPVEGAGVFKFRKGLCPSLIWSRRLGNSGKKGEFLVLKGMFSPSKHVLLVAKRGYCPRVLWIDGREKEITLQLRKGSSLQVKLIKQDWRPVKGVPVGLSSFSLGRGLSRLRLMEGKPLAGPSLEDALVMVKKSDRAGKCLFEGLKAEKYYQVSALSRTMVEVDKRPEMPKGNSGQVTITLEPLYGFWAKIKGDHVENWHLDLGPSLKKKFVRPRFYDISFLIGKKQCEWAGDILGFMVPSRGAYQEHPASPHVADLPCTTWLGERGRVTVTVAVRKVTKGFAPQVIDVSKFPLDRKMGKVLVVLQNPDGRELPFTPGMMYLFVRCTGGGGGKGFRYPGIGRRFLWKVSKRIHYLPAGKYEVQFTSNSTTRMFEAFLSKKSRAFEVRAGTLNKWGLRMKKTLVPLKFRFFAPTGEPVSYGYLNMYLATPENLAKFRLFKGVMYCADDFIQTGYSTSSGKEKIEDVVLLAPAGEEMIVHFRPEEVYGLGEFEERMVFQKKPGIQVVERTVGGRR